MKSTVLLFSTSEEIHISNVINSLLSQTRRLNEYILIENQLSSEAITEIKNLLNESSLKIISNKNGDILKSIEQGIKKATGDVIFLTNFLDTWQPNKVDLFFEEFNKEKDFIFSDAQIINEQGEDLNKTLLDIANLSTKERIQLVEYKSDQVFSTKKCVLNSTCAFRKSAFQKVFYPLISSNGENFIGSFLADMFSAYDSSKVHFIPEVLISCQEKFVQLSINNLSQKNGFSKGDLFENKMKNLEKILERVDNPHYRRSHYFWYMRSTAQGLPFLRKLISLNTLFLERDYKRHVNSPFKEFVSDLFN